MGVIVGGGKIPTTSKLAAWKNPMQLIGLMWPQLSVTCLAYLALPTCLTLSIVQSEKDFYISYQFAGALRDIYMEDPGPAPLDSWMGWSAGSWDGDTLVVEVTGLHDATWLDRAGSHHSYQMKVTERYKMMGPNHIDYEATIEDPLVLTEPFTIKMPIDRRMEPDARIMDFRCVEFVRTNVRWSAKIPTPSKLTQE